MENPGLTQFPAERRLYNPRANNAEEGAAKKKQSKGGKKKPPDRE